MSSGEAGSLIAARGPKVVSAVWRLGTPADMAGAALFLASPIAYIVGQTIVVGGGPDTLSFGTGSGLAGYLSKETRSDRDGQGSDCRFGQGFRR